MGLYTIENIDNYVKQKIVKIVLMLSLPNIPGYRIWRSTMLFILVYTLLMNGLIPTGVWLLNERMDCLIVETSFKLFTEKSISLLSLID